jgi:hypothetical protein
MILSVWKTFKTKGVSPWRSWRRDTPVNRHDRPRAASNKTHLVNANGCYTSK